MKRLRTRLFWLGIGGCVLFSCNAILGVEDEYRLGDCSGNACAGETSGGENGQSGGSGGSGASSGSSPGGEGGAGDAGTTGGGGTAGTSGTSGTAGRGGTAGTAGTAGQGGTGPCVPTGDEECLNGLDDDCNGDIDCADAECAGPVACVPGSGDAKPSTFAASAGSCPAGYSPVTLQRGLTAPMTCTGCTCVSPQTYCLAGVYAHGANTCPSSQYTGQLYNVYTNSCQPLPADRNLYMFAVDSFTECTAQGTPVPSPTAWGETRVLCVADETGGGCPSGEVCAPAITTASCVMTEGSTDCSGALPDDTGGQWFTGVTDDRTCGACDCPFNYGSGTCGGGTIVGYNGPNCTGSSETIGNGTQGSACGLMFAPVSGRVSGTASGGSCQPRAYTTGAATETGPRTVCCE